VSLASGSVLFWALIVLGAGALIAVVLAIVAWPKDNSF